MAPGTAGMTNGRLVFVSYSHEDAECLRRFLVMLQPLVRNRRLRLALALGNRVALMTLVARD